MNETVRFIDQSGAKPGAMDLWPAIVIPKETIDAEVERLASLRPATAAAARSSRIRVPARATASPPAWSRSMLLLPASGPFRTARIRRR